VVKNAIRGLVLLAALLVALAAWWPLRAPREEPTVVLDPARIVLLRTPGGFLEAGALEKVEEFGWSSRYTCPLIDCPGLLGPTISRIRVRAHFVWRVPLAEQWKLVREGDHYVLTVDQRRSAVQHSSPFFVVVLCYHVCL
jgi:hypothetical protein